MQFLNGMSTFTNTYESKCTLSLTITEYDENLHWTFSLSLQIHSTRDLCYSVTITWRAAVGELPCATLRKRPHSQIVVLSPHSPMRAKSNQQPVEEDDSATIPDISFSESPLTTPSCPIINQRLRNSATTGKPWLVTPGWPIMVGIPSEHIEIDHTAHTQARTRESVKQTKNPKTWTLGWARREHPQRNQQVGNRWKRSRRGHWDSLISSWTLMYQPTIRIPFFASKVTIHGMKMICKSLCPEMFSYPLVWMLLFICFLFHLNLYTFLFNQNVNCNYGSKSRWITAIWGEKLSPLYQLINLYVTTGYSWDSLAF